MASPFLARKAYAETTTCRARVTQDAGGDHWSPASTKSRKIWLTVEYDKNVFGEKFSAFISYKNNTPAIIEDGLFNTGPDAGLLYIRDITIDGNEYAHDKATGHHWRSGSYTLYITPPGSKSYQDALCVTRFEIEPYCVIELLSGNDYKWPDTSISFRVTEFHPYGENPGDPGYATVDPSRDQYVNVFGTDGTDYQGFDLTQRSDYLMNPGVTWQKRDAAKPAELPPGKYFAQVKNMQEISADPTNCKSDTFRISTGDNGGIIIPGENTQPNAPLSQPCSEDNLGPDGCKRINTAFGYVSTDASNFTRWVLGFILSISGGIVVLIIIITGYKLMTSQGDPEKIKNAKDQLTAAIIGLLFIIFSLAILELITKDILGLPGFGS